MRLNLGEEWGNCDPRAAEFSLQWESVSAHPDMHQLLQSWALLTSHPFFFFFNWSIVNYAKAETPVLWPPHAKSWLIGKDSDAGRGWGQEEKGTTEDEMAGWHHWLDGHESQWTLGVGDGQGDLACCDSWGRKESDTTERLIWSDLIWEWINNFMFFSAIQQSESALCIEISPLL